MYISKIEIKNYRQLKDIKLNLNEKTNILAGSNNSGKTSILELFNAVFENRGFKIEDLNLDARRNLENLLANYNEADITGKENLRKQIQKINFELKMVVRYNDDDNISLIGEFINELFKSEKNIYLIVLAEIDLDEFEMTGEIKFETKYFYSDSNFEVRCTIKKPRDFIGKFNYKKIEAKRDVDDTVEKPKNILSKKFHEILKDDEDWNKCIESIKNDLKTASEKKNESSKGIQEIFNEKKDNVLDVLIRDFEQTNGGNITDLVTSLELQDKSVLQLVEESILLKYNFSGLELSENSQGLGYSNLLYMLAEIFEFENSYDERKVNLLFIEEPESHMHPSMERKLIHYIGEKNNGIQKVLTSHSKEIVHFVELENIKVLKSCETGTKIYDLDRFCYENREDSIFIKKFINIISDILYADKAILMEGDSERIYLQHVIRTNPIFSRLNNEYISYIQVGGRHAKSYKSFVEFLNMKTLIFSDMDYKVEEEEELNKNNIQEKDTTNDTVCKFINKKAVREISKVVLDKAYGLGDRQVCFTQTEKDGYARSFEDAMLFKLYSEKLNIESVGTPFSLSNWKAINNGEKNQLGVPNPKKKQSNLLSRAKALSKIKVEFIYEIIRQDITDIPDYIDRGLKWLMKE